MKADSVTDVTDDDESQEREPAILLGIDVREFRARTTLIDGEYVLLLGDGGSALAVEQSSMAKDPNGAIDALIAVIGELDRFKDLLESRLLARKGGPNVIPFPDLGGARSGW
jgi:hypothetical protein